MIFVDSSAWFAVVNRHDRHHARATTVIGDLKGLVTSELVVVETWLLTNSRIDFATAEHFLKLVRNVECRLIRVNEDDWSASSKIAALFRDQTFSIVDRTSFALMERLGISRVVSFDDDFVIYRFGADRTRAFEVLR